MSRPGIRGPVRHLGFRARIMLALVLTSVLTLGIAALALLNPLQERLDTQDRDAVRGAALTARPALQEALYQEGGYVYGEAQTLLNQLSIRANAKVALYDSTGAVQLNLGITDPDIRDVYRVLARNATEYGVTRDGPGLAVPVIPERGSGPRVKLPESSQYFVLVVRKPGSGAGAVSAVRSAFLTAALSGFGVALVLGFALSTGLSRRLARLRRAALRMAREGPDAPPPGDDRPDEIGDVARSLRRMQIALRRQEEARRAFVSTASHELRTPLTSLQGNLELLAEDLEHGELDVDFARGQLASSRGQLRRLQNLASELLDLSRLDAGVELRREPVELGELTRAVVAEFELRAHERSVALEILPAPGPVWARGDPGAVARVVRILLDNALRFSPAGATIRLTAAYHGEHATVAVADEGPGVPFDEREIIFDRFQRGSRTGGEEGFGLGLAIGREMARRLEGELALLSARGPGATFLLSLPIELPHGSGHRTKASHPEAAR